MINIQIDETHKSARLLMDYLKTLDFVVVDDDVEPNEWQKQKLDHLVEAKEKGELAFTSWEIARSKIIP